jgi:Peptidase family M23
MRRHRTTARGVLLLLTLAAFTAGTAVAAAPKGTLVGKPIVFPLIGKAQLTSSWGDPRANGRHAGEDIIAPRRTPVVAAESGRVKWWRSSYRAGCMLYLYGESGTTYVYIHLNNDRTLKNDNSAGCNQDVTFVAGDGAKVEAGELIAWNGDSGDADGNPHLHFEVHPGNGSDVDPVPYLKAATKHLFPARVGDRFSLGLRGALVAAGDGSLELSTTAVRWWPGGRWTEIDERPIAVAVPVGASIDGDVLTLVEGAAQRFPTSRSASIALTVITAPASVTLAALRGEPSALTAARVTRSS